MKVLAVLFAITVASVCGFVAGHHIGAKRASERPTYLAVSLTGDHFLHAISTVVQDQDGRYFLQGDEIQFSSDGPTHESTLRPFALQVRRFDYFSPTEPMGRLGLVMISQRSKEETFIFRDGKTLNVDPIARMNP